MPNIVNRWGGQTIFASEAKTIRESLAEALKMGVDLLGADLRGADLRDAALRYAALRYADLRFADLRGADLRAAVCWRDECQEKAYKRLEEERKRLLLICQSAVRAFRSLNHHREAEEIDLQLKGWRPIV